MRQVCILFLLTSILLASCAKYEDNFLAPDSLEYGLAISHVSNADSSIKLSFISEPDTISNHGYYCILHYYNNQTAPEFPQCIVLVYKNSDLQNVSDQITFTWVHYPGLESVYLIPHFFDTDNDGTLEFPFILHFRDSIVFGLYELNNTPQKRWLQWDKISREDFHHCYLVGQFYSTETKKNYMVILKYNRLFGKRNDIDTLYCFNIEDNKIQFKIPIGLFVYIPNPDITHLIRDKLFFISNKCANGVSYTGFDDFHQYAIAWDTSGKLCFADTISYPNTKIIFSQYVNDSIVCYSRSYIKNKNEINDEVFYNIPQNRLVSINKLQNVFLSDSNVNKIYYPEEVNRLLSENDKLTTYDEKFDPVKQKKYPNGFFGTATDPNTNSVSDSRFNLPATGLKNIDLNGDNIPDFAKQNSLHQIIIIDGKTLNPIGATNINLYYQYFCFFKSNQNTYLVSASKNRVIFYRIVKNTFITRLNPYSNIILLSSLFLIILPISYFSIRWIFYYKELFEILSSGSHRDAIVIFDFDGKIRYLNDTAYVLLNIKNKIKNISDLPKPVFDSSQEFININENESNTIQLSYHEILISHFEILKALLNNSYIVLKLTDISSIVNEQRKRSNLESALLITHGVKSTLASAQLMFDELSEKINNQFLNDNFVRKAKVIISESIAESGDILKRLAYIAKDANNAYLETTNFSQFFNEWLSRFKRRYENRGAILVNNVKDSKCNIILNTSSFTLLLQCACDNAIESIPFEQKEKIIIFSSIETVDTLEFKISDNGLGMSDDTKNKVLNKPGFTSKQTGSGLGMQLINKVCKEHGALLDFDTLIGKGTTLIISFNRSKSYETV